MTSIEVSQSTSCCISPPTNIAGNKKTASQNVSTASQNFSQTSSLPYYQAKHCLNFSTLVSEENVVEETQCSGIESSKILKVDESVLEKSPLRETASVETHDVFKKLENKSPESTEKNLLEEPNNFDTHENNVDPSLDDFMAFIGETEKSSPSNKKKRKVTYLPGFLFPDGKPQLIEPVEETETISVSTVTENSKVTLRFGASEEECQRLTSKFFGNSFEVFSLPVTASEADIRRSFKKLSLIVHPDKCNHEKAKEAFDVVSKAYEDLQRPAMKEKYRSVYAEAKKRVLAELSAENKTRAKAKETLLPTDEDAIQDAVGTMCEKMIAEMQENAEYAERCRKANAEWEKQMGEELEREAQKEREVKRRWDETREARVENWRDFKEDVETKRIKVECFKPVVHQREQRKTSDKKPTFFRTRGIDESYKQNWR